MQDLAVYPPPAETRARRPSSPQQIPGTGAEEDPGDGAGDRPAPPANGEGPAPPLPHLKILGEKPAW